MRVPVHLVLLTTLCVPSAAAAFTRNTSHATSAELTVCHRVSDEWSVPRLMPAEIARRFPDLSSAFRLAEPEICADQIDNDCDFQRDESDCLATCGDGVVNHPAEECDDGNRLSGDGCTVSCKIPVPPLSALELNGQACGDCMKAQCGEQEHPELFSLLSRSGSYASSALACVLISGCNSSDGALGGIADCYCGDGPEQDCITFPAHPVDFVGIPRSWPDGVCRTQFEDAAGLFGHREFPRMKDSIANPGNQMRLVVETLRTCVQSACFDVCRPATPLDTFVCGGARCDLATEFCRISYGGFPAAYDSYECKPKPQACIELEDDPERCGACYLESLLLEPIGPGTRCETSPNGGIIFKFSYS